MHNRRWISPKEFLQRIAPAESELRQYRMLRPLARVLGDRRLWHLNRRTGAGAVGLGLFCCMLPIPLLQMLIAATLAILLGVNVPVSVALVWLTNPLTVVPVFYAAYELGVWMLGRRLDPSLEGLEAEGFWQNALDVWPPVLAGSLTIGSVLAIAGYCVTSWLWRRVILHRYRHRHDERRRWRKARQRKSK